jgi:adenosine deaminase
MAPRRDLRALPKAHLHLHFTGGMRRATLIEYAARRGVTLPASLRAGGPALPSAPGWARFQRTYDIARSTIRTESDVRRLVREVAEDDAAAGSGWVELQVDPTSYASRLGGLVPTVELVLDAAAGAAAATGVGVGIVLAANRTRDPRVAVTLARLAARFAGAGVVGFGLSNDERVGPAADFAAAFRIARRAGLLAVPHGGELLGPHSVRACVEHLGATRVGHGVSAVRDGEVLALLAERQVCAEVCPASNVALGVATHPGAVPLRALVDAGVPVALGADDPLLFGAGLVDQYETARAVHGFDDRGLARLAADSVRASAAPELVKRRLLDGIAGWLAAPSGASGAVAVRAEGSGVAGAAARAREARAATGS